MRRDGAGRAFGHAAPRRFNTDYDGTSAGYDGRAPATASATRPDGRSGGRRRRGHEAGQRLPRRFHEKGVGDGAQRERGRQALERAAVAAQRRRARQRERGPAVVVVERAHHGPQARVPRAIDHQIRAPGPLARLADLMFEISQPPVVAQVHEHVGEERDVLQPRPVVAPVVRVEALLGRRRL